MWLWKIFDGVGERWASRSRVWSTDITKSVPDWDPYAQPVAPEDAPNVLYIVLDDVGFSAMEPFGGLIDTPNINRIAEHGLVYTNFPHHGAVFADPLVPAERSQSHDQQHGEYHRGGRRVPQLQWAHTVRVQQPRRGARRAGLEHLRSGEVAPLP
jgi:hypothetical protein